LVEFMPVCYQEQPSNSGNLAEFSAPFCGMASLYPYIAGCRNRAAKMKTSIAPLDRLARSALRGQFGAASDAELLRRFRADKDADAFAAIVNRHGPMLIGLCKRLTRDDHLAEDASRRPS
jgi:hypothetical protein